MRIQILLISPTKDAHIRALEAEYEKRLQAFAKLETLTLPASKRDERTAVQEEELKNFLPKIDTNAFLIALDERGTQLTSEDFAQCLAKIRDFGPGKIQFLIGGSHGLHPDLLAAAHQRLSFSKMTFTHEMIRVFLKEQVYRAFTILAGKKYHK
ncbi:23S rRNA (pseudouridine(1915)-N(3))-methyltransferase RlmH [Candidatus Peregrinibacteria bacterium]|nr:MAG: 23S rRNA (pseudouridine(1915)-N(3))-methyltransferase RlmH [Candidatus Peregrinibacteria bacterium]